MHLIDVYDSSITYFSLSSFIRYFKRELFPLGAIEETHMPQYLSSWTDKNSPQCMYTVYLVCLWSIAHLRACCWYIDCRKAFCPVEEEDAKKACDEADLQGAALGANQGEVQEDEVEVDIDKLPKKEKIKVFKTLLLFHKDDLKLRADIRSYANAYNFKILKEWTGINRLPLTNARDSSKTVSASNLVMCFILLNRSI
jgi:hypothetical protein